MLKVISFFFLYSYQIKANEFKKSEHISLSSLHYNSHNTYEKNNTYLNLDLPYESPKILNKKINLYTLFGLFKSFNQDVSNTLLYENIHLGLGVKFDFFESFPIFIANRFYYTYKFDSIVKDYYFILLSDLDFFGVSLSYFAIKIREIYSKKNWTFAFSLEKKFFDYFFLKFAIPSQISLFYKRKNYFIGLGVYLDSFQGKLSDTSKNTIYDGYRFKYSLSAGMPFYRKIWWQIDIGRGFEEFDFFTNNKFLEEKIRRDIDSVVTFSLVYIQ